MDTALSPSGYWRRVRVVVPGKQVQCGEDLNSRVQYPLLVKEGRGREQAKESSGSQHPPALVCSVQT